MIVSHQLKGDMQRLRKFFFGIADGLRYIHSRNIIHRDLKPDNIFLTDNDTIKIGDFGLATTRTSSSTIRCGTRYYMAPEIGTKRVTARADMYSFGIILFEMCYPMMTNREDVIKKIRQINSPIKDYLFNHQFYNVRMINIFYTKYQTIIIQLIACVFNHLDFEESFGPRCQKTLYSSKALRNVS